MLRRTALLGGVALALSPKLAAAQDDSLPKLASRMGRLRAEVERCEAIRAVKRLQHSFAHYGLHGLWKDGAAVFTEDGVAKYRVVTLNGRAEIERYSIAESGRGKIGLEEGRLHAPFVLSPVVTVNGDTAKARWREFMMLGQHGRSATWIGALYENTYVREAGVWKLKELVLHSRFSGPYEGGWRTTKEGAAIAPFHYTPTTAGLPALPETPPPARASMTTLARQLADLDNRIGRMLDEDAIQRLQNAYGYYVDRKMWDDVADLMTGGATLEIGNSGLYRGKARVRRALEVLIGPAGLKAGELGERPQLEMVVTLSPDGRTATARGLELAMTGVNNQHGEWGFSVFENAYAKEGGVWKLRAVRLYPLMTTDYAQGWAKDAKPLAGPNTTFPPDQPTKAAYAAYPKVFVPPFSFAHPVTGPRPAPAAGRPPRVSTPGRFADQLFEVETRCSHLWARDAAENLSNAYGYYIDEFMWNETADLFSRDGWKELSYIGAFVGRERVRQSMIKRYGLNGRSPTSMTLHQTAQPVVNVAPDGRSARVRTRLFQMNSANENPGSYIGGIYENRIVKEDNVWKIAGMDLDYTFQANYVGGWAKVEPRTNTRFAPRAGANDPFKDYPPDRPLRGVTFAPYPDTAPMAFHYPNPVSGRMPPVSLPEV